MAQTSLFSSRQVVAAVVAAIALGCASTPSTPVKPKIAATAKPKASAAATTAPVPTATPTPALPSATPIATPTPMATTDTPATKPTTPSPSPSSRYQVDLTDPTITYEGDSLSILVAGGTVGPLADGIGPKAFLGRNEGSVGMDFERPAGDLLKLFFTDATANEVRDMAFADSNVLVDAGDLGHQPSGADAATTYLDAPGGLAYDATSKVFYVSDTGHRRILRYYGAGNTAGKTEGACEVIVDGGGTPAEIAEPVFRDGPGLGDVASRATLAEPRGLALSGTTLYIADASFHCIRMVDLAATSYDVTTLAGGHGTPGAPSKTPVDRAAATFQSPVALALSGTASKPTLYVAELDNHCIRAIDLTTATGQVSVYAGSGDPSGHDGPRASASFFAPTAVAADGLGNLYVGEVGTPRLRKIDPLTNNVTTIAGTSSTGFGVHHRPEALFQAITGLAVERDTDGGTKAIYAYDPGPIGNPAGGAGPRIVKVIP